MITGKDGTKVLHVPTGRVGRVVRQMWIDLWHTVVVFGPRDEENIPDRELEVVE